jgi:hypothetical protein
MLVDVASVFLQDISSAIIFSDVEIHWELTPNGELMSNEQKKRASKRPSLDFRQDPVVQLRADVLSVTFRRTGYLSFVTFSVRIKCNAAQ